MNIKKGISAAPGVAIGPALVLDTEEFRIPRRPLDPAQAPRQVELLDAALDASRQEVRELRAGAARSLGEKTAEIFTFHEAFIVDPVLRNDVVELIQRRCLGAAHAFSLVMNEKQRAFRAVAEPYLKERVKDLFDIEKRVLRHILGRAREDISKLTEPVVIVANDLPPSQVVTLDPRRILGLALNVGGSTSHTAILARMHGIPAVVGLADISGDVSASETVIVDGNNGIVVVDPDRETVEHYEAQRREQAAYELRLAKLRDLPAVTTDETRITLMGNIEFAGEAEQAVAAGAEGVGLYRTEFLFLSSDKLPGEEQQYEVYRSAVRGVAGRPITIRTMDLGAEKMADYLDRHKDHNPVLGLRSLRYCLQHLDLLKTHLRAILRAAAEGTVRIMFPMVTTIMELRQAKATLNDVMEDLEEEGIPYGRGIPIGIMVETPAAAMQCAAFARECQFLSLGTNDLTQYTLAVDRGNERVAHLYAPHHPAVLRLIRETVNAGRKASIPVSVCGEMAAVPIYTELLIGLGVRELSMSCKEIPEIKQIIRRTSLKRCRAIAGKVMKFDVDRQILNYLRDKLREINDEVPT